MKFGPVPIDEAVGALAAHGIRTATVTVRKGSRITAETATSLKAAGHGTIVVARLEPGDVGEDEAAHRIAQAVAGPGTRVEAPFTGRSNLFALDDGLLVVDRAGVAAVNAVDEAITFATLPAFKPVVAGEMIGTVKIIPYAVPATAVEEAASGNLASAISVAIWQVREVGVVSTLLPGLKSTTVTKTLAALSARLAPAHARIGAAEQVTHETKALATILRGMADASSELIVVFGASAIADRRDVIPAAIEAAGGRVEHFGMPVDPGNLLLVGRLGDKPVVGAPGCARSPKENGFDWVLQRLLAGLEVTRSDITALGVGGLLMEIISRGQPREGGPSAEDGTAED